MHRNTPPFHLVLSSGIVPDLSSSTAAAAAPSAEDAPRADASLVAKAGGDGLPEPRGPGLEPPRRQGRPGEGGSGEGSRFVAFLLPGIFFSLLPRYLPRSLLSAAGRAGPGARPPLGLGVVRFSSTGLVGGAASTGARVAGCVFVLQRGDTGRGGSGAKEPAAGLLLLAPRFGDGF